MANLIWNKRTACSIFCQRSPSTFLISAFCGKFCNRTFRMDKNAQFSHALVNLNVTSLLAYPSQSVYPPPLPHHLPVYYTPSSYWSGLEKHTRNHQNNCSPIVNIADRYLNDILIKLRAHYGDPSPPSSHRQPLHRSLDCPCHLRKQLQPTLWKCSSLDKWQK